MIAGGTLVREIEGRVQAGGGVGMHSFILQCRKKNVLFTTDIFADISSSKVRLSPCKELMQ